MPDSRETKQSPGQRTTQTRAAKPAPPPERVRDLAWAGLHEQAIELATAALAATRLSVTSRADCLDLRAESFMTQGDLARASSDAAEMLDLADRAGTARLEAQARNRLSLLQMRKGELKAAVATANAALKASRQSKQVGLEAMSLFRLAEAHFRAKINLGQAVRDATRAAQLFHTLRKPVGEGRAHWVMAAARASQGRAAESDQAARAALALCRKAGDAFGAGNALNIRVFNEADLATQLKLLQQALADFEAAGYVERQGIVTGNLGVAYRGLGLYRRARRLMLKSRAIYRRTGWGGTLKISLAALAETEVGLGHLDNARTHIAEMAGLAEAGGDLLVAALVPLAQGRLALLEGDGTALS